MNRKLNVGMVGGGNDSFMGHIHRSAIEQSGRVELVCGAFGSTRNTSFETGKRLQLPTQRVYGIYRDMFRRETALPDGERMDFAVILAPNAMHYPVAMSALDAKFPVFCEKPYTCTLDEALNLSRKQKGTGLPYGIAMAYQGYPMLQKARELILKDKAIGTVRKIIVLYPLGWLAQRLETAGSKQANWRADPRRCGPAGCLADLGTHCFYVAEWLSGLTVSEVCADLRATIAGRILDDDCSILARFNGGARGIFLTSQVATGRNDGLSIEVAGDKGTLTWVQRIPERLVLRRPDCSEEILQGGIATDPISYGPAPYGNNTAYIAALAATYSAFADYLDASKAAQTPPPSPPGFMTVEEGLRNVAFVDAVLKNTAAPETGQPPPAKWTPLIVPPIPDPEL